MGNENSIKFIHPEKKQSDVISHKAKVGERRTFTRYSLFKR